MAKCKTTVILFFLLLGAVVISPAYTATIEVYPGESIQSAINQAVSGDTIFVFSGLYTEDIVMKDSVDLIGESYNSVVISGRISFQDSSSTMKDVTIIFPEGNFLTYVNTYYNGFSLQDDAGITIINSAPTIQNCLIMPALEYYGKGIQIWNMYNNPDTAPQIKNNIILDTEIGIYYFAQAFGGAILGQIKNNTLYHNKDGIILRMHKEKPGVRNNIIMDGDSGIFLTYSNGNLLDERKSLMHHNDIWNILHKYWLDEDSSEFDLTGFNGNISADPLFLSPINYDFSLNVGSPCIGQADDGGNMGAQLTPPSSPSMPQVELIPPATNQRYIAIEGAKDANASIIINGEEYVPIDSETVWTIPSYDLGTDGEKILLISSKNIYGLESSAVTVNITLDSVPPEITITSPTDGATFDTAPITVSGTINEECDIVVNGVLASIEGNTFTAENVNLRNGQNTITATGYDLAGNSSIDTITVTSTVSSDYNITKVSLDVYEYDPTNLMAGSQCSLTIRLEIDGAPAQNEPIEYHITQGSGSMVQAVVNTNASGEATGVLNTDANASVTNLIEVFDQNFPSKKVTFHIDTKEGIPASLLKLTDENIHPAPGADMELTVKLEDSNHNPIPNEEIAFQITSGPGTLKSNSAVTVDDGSARVILQTISAPSTSCTIHAQCVSNASLITDFTIITSGSLTVTLNDIDAKVALNNSKIQDIMGDAHVVSTAPWLAAVTELKIWRKGIKQKTQEISPEPGVYIKSPAEQTGPPAEIDRQIIGYDPATSVYAIKSKILGQITEYPYQITHVDYDKGVVTKVEHYTQDDEGNIATFTEILSNYIAISGAWIFHTCEETWSSTMKTDVTYVTTTTYNNIVVNSGIPDSVFEE